MYFIVSQAGIFNSYALKIDNSKTNLDFIFKLSKLFVKIQVLIIYNFSKSFFSRTLCYDASARHFNAHWYR